MLLFCQVLFIFHGFTLAEPLSPTWIQDPLFEDPVQLVRHPACQRSHPISSTTPKCSGETHPIGQSLTLSGQHPTTDHSISSKNKLNYPTLLSGALGPQRLQSQLSVSEIITNTRPLPGFSAAPRQTRVCTGARPTSTRR